MEKISSLEEKIQSYQERDREWERLSSPSLTCDCLTG
jgi:hypothetical protein